MPGEENVVAGMPEPVANSGVVLPGEHPVQALQIPQAHRGRDTGQRRVLDRLAEPAVIEDASGDLR